MSVEVEEVPVVAVLEYVARRLEVDVTRQGSLFFFGAAREQDRAYLVRRVGRLNAEDIRGMLATVITDFGEFYVSESDGLLVVSEHLGVLRRISEVLDQVQALGRSSWVVQLYLVTASASSQAEYGVDTSVDIELAAKFASTGSQSDYQGEARAALRGDIERQAVSVYARPLFVLLDGGEASLRRGQVVPVPEFTTLETGAVVTSGYTDVEVGLTVDVSLREWEPGRASLTYSVVLGEISGFVDDRVPVRVEDELSGELAIISGGTYLVGSLDRRREGRTRSGVLQVGFGRDSESTELEVWAMVTRVNPTGMSEIGEPGQLELEPFSYGLEGLGMLRDMGTAPE